MQYTFASVRRQASGVELFSLEGGQGPPLILLHGVTANAWVWQPVMERLASVFHLVAIDQRGHGRSGRPPGARYAALNYANDVIELTRALGEGPATIVGHSLGARNALVVGAQHPDAVSAVIAVDFTPYIEPEVFDALDERTKSGFASFQTLNDVRTYLRGRYPRLPEDAVERRAVYGYERCADGQYRPLADAHAVTATCAGLREDLSGAIHALRVPTLLVRGLDSRVVSTAAFGRTQALRSDLDTVVVADADHYVHEEQPEVLADLIEHFVSRVRSASGCPLGGS
jgi:2-(acetamidomethylene)succinate hydrolase